MFRGGRIPSDIHVGQVFGDKGFGSSTVKENIAKKFMRQGSEKQGFYEIRMRKGTKGYAVRATHYSEAEIILHRNAEYLVLEVKKLVGADRNRFHIVVEVII